MRVARGFQSPVYVATTRSQPSRLYVVEQVGRIWVLANGKRRAQPFLDIRSRVGADSSEQGLLSMAFHPLYARNRRFYVNYTDLSGHTRVVEFRSDGQRGLTRTARQLLFVRQPYANHNGGQIQFGPDGKLYVGMGDGGAGGDPDNNGQTPTSRLAKLLRTNPLAVDWETVGFGLRNPWRFTFDRKTGDLYIGDVGQNAIEEINYAPRRSAGLENYGWDVYEGRARYEDKEPSTGTLVFPIAQYSHSEGISVTGGHVYRGRAIPALRGRYVYGDFGSGTIWTLRVAGGRATQVRRESIRVSSLSSFGEDAAGELYATSLEGTVYRITR